MMIVTAAMVIISVTAMMVVSTSMMIIVVVFHVLPILIIIVALQQSRVATSRNIVTDRKAAKEIANDWETALCEPFGAVELRILGGGFRFYFLMMCAHDGCHGGEDDGG